MRIPQETLKTKSNKRFHMKDWVSKLNLRLNFSPPFTSGKKCLRVSPGFFLSIIGVKYFKLPKENHMKPYIFCKLELVSI